ncbi:MAG: hypothetical protein EOL98_13595, partial [Negativicutes bacterium]|nr:hypothetical protein [Negativicutes bacterium]
MKSGSLSGSKWYTFWQKLATFKCLKLVYFILPFTAGEGLLFFGNTIVPFIDKFPKDTMLYKLMTTKP